MRAGHYDRSVPAPPLRRCLTELARPLAWLALGGSLAGCAHGVQIGRGGVLHVALSEYRLGPDQASARAGALTIVARNFGRLTHNLVISSKGQARGTIRPLAPGQTGRVTVSLAPGNYQLASSILSDQALGVYGTLTVTS